MRSLFRLALFLLLGLASATPLFADQNWLGGTSTDWNNPLNWSSAVPGSTDAVTINTELGGQLPSLTTAGGTVLALEVGGGTGSGAPTQGAGVLTIGPTGSLTVTDQVWVGVYADTVNSASISTLNLAGTLTCNAGGGQNFHVGWDGGNGQVFMTGSSLLTQTTDSFYIGCDGGGTTGLFSMTGNSTANITADMRIGDDEWGTAGGCSGSLTMSGSTTISRTGGAYIIFGEGNGTANGATGYCSLSNNAKIVSSAVGTPTYIASIGHDGGRGTLTMSDNSQFQAGELMIGQNLGVGTLNVSGGTVTLGNNLSADRKSVV